MLKLELACLVVQRFVQRDPFGMPRQAPRLDHLLAMHLLLFQSLLEREAVEPGAVGEGEPGPAVCKTLVQAQRKLILELPLMKSLPRARILRHI